MTDRAEILRQVVESLARRYGLDPARIRPEARIGRDLGLTKRLFGRRGYLALVEVCLTFAGRHRMTFVVTLSDGLLVSLMVEDPTLTVGDVVEEIAAVAERVARDRWGNDA